MQKAFEAEITLYSSPLPKSKRGFFYMKKSLNSSWMIKDLSWDEFSYVFDMKMLISGYIFKLIAF